MTDENLAEWPLDRAIQPSSENFSSGGEAPCLGTGRGRAGITFGGLTVPDHEGAEHVARSQEVALCILPADTLEEPPVRNKQGQSETQDGPACPALMIFLAIQSTAHSESGPKHLTSRSIVFLTFWGGWVGGKLLFFFFFLCYFGYLWKSSRCSS